MIESCLYFLLYTIQKLYMNSAKSQQPPLQAAVVDFFILLRVLPVLSHGRPAGP